MKGRGLRARRESLTDEQKKGLVRALGNRIMYGISQVSTVTPHALVSAALLAHRRRGITSRELTDRITILRRIAGEDGAPLATLLKDSPSRPRGHGPHPGRHAHLLLGRDGAHPEGPATRSSTRRRTSGAASCPSTRTR